MLVFGQPSPEGITVTISRQLTAAPSEAQFLINVAADGSKTLEEVVAVVQPLGITASDLVSVTTFPYGGPFPYTGPPDPSKVNYLFRLAAPAAKTKETIDRISRLRRDLDASFDLQQQMVGIGPAAGEVEQARKRMLPELLMEARRRAEELASAANVKVGSVQGMFDSSFAPTGVFYGPVQAAYTYTITVRYGVE
jgi:hypothetical protein